jgi:hypothetical protein
LPANASNPSEKLRLVFDGVRRGHKIGGCRSSRSPGRR